MPIPPSRSLELPPYTTFEACRRKLLYAVANCPAIDTDFAGHDEDAWRELENMVL